MKYLKHFSSVADANTQGGGGLYSPHISIVEGKQVVNYYSAATETFTAEFDENGAIIMPKKWGIINIFKNVYGEGEHTDLISTTHVGLMDAAMMNRTNFQLILNQETGEPTTITMDYVDGEQRETYSFPVSQYNDEYAVSCAYGGATVMYDRTLNRIYLNNLMGATDLTNGNPYSNDIDIINTPIDPDGDVYSLGVHSMQELLNGETFSIKDTLKNILVSSKRCVEGDDITITHVYTMTYPEWRSSVDKHKTLYVSHSGCTSEEWDTEVSAIDTFMSEVLNFTSIKYFEQVINGICTGLFAVKINGAGDDILINCMFSSM